MNGEEQLGGRPRLRIVVVDDCETDRVVMRHHISAVDSFEAEIEEAATGEEGLEMCRRNPPDCVLLDLHLTDTSGLDVLATLRTDPETYNVPVVMLTGASDERVAVAAMKAGAADFLTKDSISWTSLSRSISNALQKAEMRRSVDESVRNLELTNEELANRNEEIRSFYHAVSHQLKTPLAVACENVSLILEGLFGEVSVEARVFLETALGRVQQVAGCVDDVSEAMAFAAGDVCLYKERTDLVRLAECAIRASEHKHGTGREVELIAEDSLPLTLVDPARIARVMDCLLENAIRHSPPGGKVTVRITSNEDGGQAVAIEDVGSGIDPQHAGRIFDRLYRADLDATSGETGTGLGLGLYLCREILKIHGGEIVAESRPGQGAVLRFTLPADGAEQCERAEPGSYRSAS